MIEWIKAQWRTVFPTSPFFKFDGWFGRDKVGHFTRHVLTTTFYGWAWPAIAGPGGYMGPWAITLVDTISDICYEYMNYRTPTNWEQRKTIGFSILDVCYGRLGHALTMLVLINLGAL